MPELPEVNTVGKGFAKVALHQPIKKVTIHDAKIIRNVSPDVFIKTLRKRSFIDTYRQGKYFFGVLDDGIHVLFHLGMTGDIHYYFDAADRPKHERFNIQVESGMTLGYDDPRKFSHILIVKNLANYLKKIKLGPDALRISLDEFHSIFSHRKTSLKAVLLNQQLIAGIGNLYADEICYQAKIHPGSTAGALSTRQRKNIFSVMREILLEACKRDAYYKLYPDDWFWKWRTDDMEIIKGKGKIGKQKIAGRTTYFIEGYQKLIR